MSWGYVAVAAATVVGGALSSNSARRAGNAAARGADAATNESARQYDQTRADLAPYRTTGGGALNRIGQLFGLPTTTSEEFSAQQPMLVGDTELPSGTTTKSVGNGYYEVSYGGQRIGTLQPGGKNGQFVNDTGADIQGLFNSQRQQTQQGQQGSGTGDLSSFFQSPGYQFRRDEGTRGIERGAAARGGAFSGNALKALAEFNSGLASQEFGNYFNQLASVAGIGQTSTNQTAAYGAQAANQQGRNAMYAGDARASGIIGQSNAYGNTLQDLGGLAGDYFGRKKAPKANTTMWEDG